MLWFNTGLAEIKQNYHCAGVSIAGKTEWDLIIKKKSEIFYDVYHSAYPHENPFYARFVEQGNMLMWFSSYKDGSDRMLFIDMFEIHSSGNTHLVLTVSNFKSTAEFDRIHRMYVGIVEMKKNPNDTGFRGFRHFENFEYISYFMSKF